MDKRANYEPKIDVRERAQLQLREGILDALSRNIPIQIHLPKGNGDKLWQAWACTLPVQKIAEENEVNPNFRIVAYSSTPPEEPGFKLSAQLERAQIALGMFTHAKSNFYQDEVWRSLKSIGVDPSEQDLNNPPEPLPIEDTLFQNFDKNLVSESGEDFRAKSPGKTRYVVTQSGSEIGKRLSDVQVAEIVDLIRKNNSGSHISVVSDRFFLGEKALDPESVKADEVVSGNDINEYSSRMYASDFLIGTDSFYGWLGLGNMSMRLKKEGLSTEGKGVLLYTLADPDAWSVPGVIPVEAVALQRAKQQHALNQSKMIDKFEYLYTQGYDASQILKPGADIRSGVHPQDFSLLKTAVVKNLF